MPNLQRPESSPGCHTHLPLCDTFFVLFAVHTTGQLAQDSLGILLRSHHSSSRRAGVSYIALGIQTQILMLVWQVLCALSNLSPPMMCYNNGMS